MINTLIVFYSEWTDAQSLSDMDFELINLLYSPSLHAGMEEVQGREALRPLVRAKFADYYSDLKRLIQFNKTI